MIRYGNLLPATARAETFTLVSEGETTGDSSLGSTSYTVDENERATDGAYVVELGLEKHREAYRLAITIVTSGATAALTRSPYAVAVSSKLGPFAPKCSVTQKPDRLTAGVKAAFQVTLKDAYDDECDPLIMGVF